MISGYPYFRKPPNLNNYGKLYQEISTWHVHPWLSTLSSDAPTLISRISRESLVAFRWSSKKGGQQPDITRLLWCSSSDWIWLSATMDSTIWLNPQVDQVKNHLKVCLPTKTNESHMRSHLEIWWKYVNIKNKNPYPTWNNDRLPCMNRWTLEFTFNILVNHILVWFIQLFAIENHIKRGGNDAWFTFIYRFEISMETLGNSPYFVPYSPGGAAPYWCGSAVSSEPSRLERADTWYPEPKITVLY